MHIDSSIWFGRSSAKVGTFLSQFPIDFLIHFFTNDSDVILITTQFRPIKTLKKYTFSKIFSAKQTPMSLTTG